MWETAFDVTDTTFDCNVNRTNGNPSTQLATINHFLDQIILGQPAPDPEAANVTNGVSGTGSLGLQVQTCAAVNGRNPNFMLVDVCVIVCIYQSDNNSLYAVLRVRWWQRVRGCCDSQRCYLRPRNACTFSTLYQHRSDDVCNVHTK